MIQANAHIILDESELSINPLDYLASATFKLVGQMRLHIHLIREVPTETESYWLTQLRAVADVVHLHPESTPATQLQILRKFGGVLVPRRYACRSPIIQFLLKAEELVSTFILSDGTTQQILGLSRGSDKTPTTETPFSEYQDLTDPVTQFLLWRAHKEEDRIPVVAYDHLTAVKYDILSADRVREYQCTYTMALNRTLTEATPDVTFVIPVKIDSQDRLENLLTVIEYSIAVYGVKHIIVSEYDESPQLLGVLKRFPEVRYCFCQPRPESSWNKSIAVNVAAKLVTTSIMAIWDADIVIPYTSFQSAVRTLQKGHEVCVPYDIFTHVHRQCRAMFQARTLSAYDLSMYLVERTRFNAGNALSVTAAVVFIRTPLFTHIRGMSELFHGWGFEDVEFAGRLGKFAHTAIIPGPMYHISHTRTPSTRPDPNTERRSRFECVKIHQMGKEQLCAYLGVTPEIGDSSKPPEPVPDEILPLPESDHSIVVNREDRTLQYRINPLL